MANSQIGFGILGCAEIARKISCAIALSPNATLKAISSCSVEKAKRFALDNNLPLSVKVYGSYEEVLDDRDVDIVYIPLPTTLHLQWAVLAAQKKKHVLLEKPVALSTYEFDQIAEACESNGVQFMDGTMYMHHPRTQKMRDFLDDPEQFGQLKSVHSVFTKCVGEDFLKNDIRVNPDLDALGALGNLGWYCIRSILWATNYKFPKTVTAFRGTVFNSSGVILSCGASLQWKDGTLAFHCSFLSNLTMDLSVLGTAGTRQVHDFEGSQLGWKSPSNDVVVTNDLSQVHMVREFARLVRNMKETCTKPDADWPSVSRKTQLVLDAVKASIENGFQSIEIVM